VTELRCAVEAALEAMADESRAAQPKRDALLQLLAPAEYLPGPAVTVTLVRNLNAEDVIAMYEHLAGKKATPEEKAEVEAMLATRQNPRMRG
jgi:hypothetical protein